MRFILNLSWFLSTTRKMSIFTLVKNPITGKSEWTTQPEDYDYHQEVARSAFADMLHDSERNQKYYAALKKEIKKIHDNGQKANVLDIGTGTGILSMMAAEAGADSITACEAFTPMANCAEKIIKSNGYDKRINLVRKRSQELTVGQTGDMKERANVLVTEVFDTELIGEGAIGVFNHANSQLLTKDAVTIPSSATIYIQIVESPLVFSWSRLKSLVNLDGELLLRPPKSVQECGGDAAVHDVQLSQLDVNLFKELTPPTAVFQFNFCTANTPKSDKKVIRTTATKAGVAQMVFFWWDLNMDMNGEIVLSCAPYWSHRDFPQLSKSGAGQIPLQNVIPWRDHWMQAIYYLPKTLHLQQGEEFCITGYHDEYSFWFAAGKEAEELTRLACTCGTHTFYPRLRVGQMNNSHRNKQYISAFEEILDDSANVLCLSWGSLLCLSAAKMGPKSVTCVEERRQSQRIIEEYIKENNCKNAKVVSSLDAVDNLPEITHIVAEPFYATSILPWDNFYFGTLLMKIKEQLKDDVKILPVGATIYALPVEFLDLHKIRAPLERCEGFDLSIFDEYIEASTELADAVVEAQPLWEYPCKALGTQKEILQVDFRNFDLDKLSSGEIQFGLEGNCNGIALWVDWKLCDSDKPKYTVSTGPEQSVELGKWIKWDMYTKQGVHLFPHPRRVTPQNSVKWQCSFTPKSGEMSFSFTTV